MQIIIDWSKVEINIIDNVVCITGLFPYELMFCGNSNSDIEELLYENYGIEVRFCEECGRPYSAGFIAGDGDWYCCEDCFDNAMNAQHGRGRWKTSDEEGVYGGWYEALTESGIWEDTGIFYTEWY